MKDRVIGIENEYALNDHEPDDDAPEALRVRSNIAAALSGAIHQGIYDRNRLWIKNGGVLYVDQSKLEYATPECRRIRDVVAYNKAGEKLIHEVTKNREGEQLFDFYKTNVAPQMRNEASEARNVSFGCHENYLTYNLTPPANKDSFESTYCDLLPFLITRQVYGGSGWWQYPERDVFWRSQRAFFTYKTSSTTATNTDRGILSEKSDPHTVIPGYGRYHIVMGDANMLEYAMYLKFGATMIIMNMLEEHLLPRWNITTRADGSPDAVKAFQDVALLSDLNEKILFITDRNGKVQLVSPLELQSYLCELAGTYIANTKFDSEASEFEAKEIHKMWKETLTALHRDDSEFLTGRIDWYTKRQIVESESLKEGAPPINTIRADYDILYHQTGEATVYEDLIKSGIAKRILTDEEIATAMYSAMPPTPERGTRATVRADAIVEAMRMKRGAPAPWMDPGVDWDIVTYPAGMIKRVDSMVFVTHSNSFAIPLPDPLESTSKIYNRFKLRNA